MRTLIKNGHVVTVNASHAVFDGGFVAIRDDRIEAVGLGGGESFGPFDEIVDASGMIVIPGLINAHQHPWMNLVKGLADGLLLEPWIFRFVQPFLNAITVEDVRVSAYLSALEMVRTGTTCVLDHTTRLPDGYEDALIAPMAEVGIRHMMAKQFQCRTPKLSDFPLSASEAQDGVVDLVRRYDKANDGLTRIALAIECNAHHTELGKSSDELVLAGHEVACRENLRIPVHMSGGTLSMSMGFLKYLRLTGRRDVEYLERLGVLDERWILKHGIHFSDRDIEMVRTRGSHVIYTPTSEAIRGGGFGPVAKLHAAGINCALGSDGPAVDYSVDMVEQMKACLYLQRVKHRDGQLLDAATVLEMATINAAVALGMADSIGSIEPGKLADIAIFDLSSPRLAPIADPLLALVCAARGADAHTVFVNGRMLLRGGAFAQFKDADRVVAEASERGRRIAAQAKLGGSGQAAWPAPAPAQVAE